MAIGGAEDHDNGAVILRRFSAICGGDAARLIIIPTASSRTDTGERYVRLFRGFGVRDVAVLHLRRRPEAYEAEPLAVIGRATGVLFTGGDQMRLRRVIHDTPFADGLKARNAAGLHVAGTSAGAAFLCAQMIVRGKRGATPRNGMVTVEPGLGLTDHIIIDQHFSQRDRLGRLLTALSLYPVEVGIGVDEDTVHRVVRLDYLHNLTFTNCKPSVAAILGDERADKQARHFGRPGFTIKVRTGDNPEDFAFVPFPLGQGVFHLDQAFTDVAGARLQQFNRSPQQFSQPQEVDASFIEVAIPYAALGGLQPGDEITIGAVVGTKGVYENQFRQLDTTHLGNSLTTGKDLVCQLDIYQLEGWKVRLAIDPDPDDDGLLTARERERGTDPAKRDTDGDLLPDGWEVARGLDPLKHDGDAALALDPDGDGVSIADELAAGTDPMDGDSYFTLQVETTDDGIRLHWHAIPGATYQVIAAGEASGPYQALGQAQKLEGEAAAEMELALPSAQLNQPASYYRLQLTPKE